MIWVLKDEEAVDGLEGYGMPGSAMGEREREVGYVTTGILKIVKCIGGVRVLWS